MYRIRSSSTFSFIVSSLAVSPFVLLGSYVIGVVWSMLGMDQAVYLWFFGIPTFVAMNCTATLLVFRSICMFMVSKKVTIITTMLASVLSIPMQLFSVLAISSFWDLIIDQTNGEAALNWIIVSLSTCILTIAVCGLVILISIESDHSK